MRNTICATLLLLGMTVFISQGRAADDRPEGGRVGVSVGPGGVHVEAERAPASALRQPTVEERNRITFRSSHLLGLAVKNMQGEDLGQVQDLVIDAQQGRVSHVMLSLGGFLGMGDRVLAVPFHSLALKERSGGADDYKDYWLALDLDRQRAGSAPSFERDQLPNFSLRGWDRDIDVFWGDRDRKSSVDSRMQTAPPAAVQTENVATSTVRVSDLLEMDVRNATNENLGDARDLVVDMTTGQIRYVALSAGGVLGIGDKLFAVPWNVLRLNQSTEDLNDRWLVLNVDNDRLRTAPGFNENQWPNVADLRWSQEIDSYYGDASQTARVPADAPSR